MGEYINRGEMRQRVDTALRRSPVVAIIGPRQCGKTTLARAIAEDCKAHYFDLEDSRTESRLANPMLALEPLKGLVILDEIQLVPDLFPALRVLSDRPAKPASFLILGSASPELVSKSAETLAGRIEYVDMGGFSLGETGCENLQRLWLRGGFPRSFLPEQESDSFAWRENFVRTFLERDIPRFGINIPAQSLRRLWTMLAHYHGQILNASELGRSLAESYMTIKRHMDILTGALMVRQVQPWHENIKKRQAKAPKVYLRDSGILHLLLDIESMTQLGGHPKLGASWEGFAVEQILSLAGGRQAYFWRTVAGAELDLLLFHNGKRIGVECKYADAPAATKSMHIALGDLGLDMLLVVHPGRDSYRLTEKIEVVSLPDAVGRLAGRQRRGEVNCEL